MKPFHLAFAILLMLAPPALAQSVRISRATPGYSYFNRPGADMARHDADLRDCAATGFGMLAEERRSTHAAPNGLLGALIGGLIAGHAQKGTIAAGIENCMVVRGWRVVILDAAVGARWAAQAPAVLSRTLEGQVGADAPLGRVARVWNNDAARAGSSRFELRPPFDGVQLGLLTLPVAQLIEHRAAPHDYGRVTLDELTRGPPAERWDSIGPNRALIVVGMKGTSPGNGVSLNFSPMISRGDRSDLGFMVFRHGLAASGTMRYYVFEVAPGSWRLSTLSALVLCLGAPAFDVAPGEVVYAGGFDLSAPGIGPDLDIAGARAFLAGHAAAERLKPAGYRNGSVGSCAYAPAIYALEIPGAPFDPEYRWGSRSVAFR